MDLGLKGKRAIVTGGSRGIGRAIALALGAEGVRVCVTARDEGLLETAVSEINAAGGEGMSVSADLVTFLPVLKANLFVHSLTEVWGSSFLLEDSQRPRRCWVAKSQDSRPGGCFVATTSHSFLVWNGS